MNDEWISLDVSAPIWNRFFTVASLVIVGTKEDKGYDMAPKHLAIPMGFDNYFGFVCTPRHKTYGNVQKAQEFSISYPMPNQLVTTSLAASPRKSEHSKSEYTVKALATVKATKIDALLISDSYVHLECRLFKVIDGFGENSLITGEILSARVNTLYLRVSEQDEQKQLQQHPLLAYIADGRFAVIKDTFAFPFPKGFTR
ncbi:flavin reductase [Ascidiimonas aurantiaca]|uniref:flavin reductase n=1 Tax=Ascidiimonas aurantiaca TaxID=1685432 RepID=UPI0030EF1848